MPCFGLRVFWKIPSITFIVDCHKFSNRYDVWQAKRPERKRINNKMREREIIQRYKTLSQRETTKRARARGLTIK